MDTSDELFCVVVWVVPLLRDRSAAPPCKSYSRGEKKPAFFSFFLSWILERASRFASAIKSSSPVRLFGSTGAFTVFSIVDHAFDATRTRETVAKTLLASAFL